MGMEVFLFNDEIAAIAKFLEENAAVKKLKTSMAKAAGCQLSYLSQAMAGKVHLTPDHIHGIARFMRLSGPESEYLMLLLQMKRAASIELRDHLQKKIKQLRDEEFRVEKKIKAKDKISDRDLQSYYSDWRFQAVHMYLTVPRYQRIGAIAEKLSLPELQVRRIVESLTTMGLARRKGDLWLAELKDMHLPAQSPLMTSYQLQWKMRSLQDSQENTTGVHYLATFSISKSDIEKLKGMAMEFISNSRKLAAASAEEEVAHLSLSSFTL